MLKSDMQQLLKDAEIFYKQGEVRKAECILEKLLHENPQHTIALQALAQIELQQHRYQAALQCYQKLIKQGVFKTLEPHLVVSALYSRMRNFDQAERVCKWAFDHFDNHSRIYQELGYLYYKYHRFSDSKSAYERAWKLDPTNFETFFPYAELQTFKANDPLINLAHSALTLGGLTKPTRAKLLFTLGKVARDLQNYGESFSYYAKANQIMAKQSPYLKDQHHQVTRNIISRYSRDEPLATHNLPAANHQPIFVIGTSRSGKTLVERILSQHSNVLGAGEGEEWSIVLQSCLARHFKGSPEQAILTQEEKKKIGDDFMALVAENCPSYKQIIHSAHSGYWYVGLILQIFPKAKIIYCKRDPMDNCWAAYCKYYSTGNGYSYALDCLGAFYKDYDMIMNHWQGVYGKRILQVSYEQIVTEPQTVIPQLFAYCNLTPVTDSFNIALSTREIGHWKPYQKYLRVLQQSLA